MQAMFDGSVPGWNGAIGLGHVASRDLAHWTVLPPALVPGQWPGPPGRVGQPAGNATGGYYSGSATVVDGQPRIVVPAVFGTDVPGQFSCRWTAMHGSNCTMLYVVTTPANTSDPWLRQWTEPVVIVDGRVDGVQPHGPGFDDVTHAWRDPQDPQTWRFAGQTTVCATPGCTSTSDTPEYLQLWASKNGSDWSQGFRSLGNLFPSLSPQYYIANVPDLWQLPAGPAAARVWLLHFGSNLYFLGNYSRAGPGFNETHFVPLTPAQSFGPGAAESHGFYDGATSRFLWFGCVGGSPPSEPGVPAWDGYLTVARVGTVDWSLSTVGDFAGMMTFYPAAELELLRRQLLFASDNLLSEYSPDAQGRVWLPAVGYSLDIEVNVSFPDGSVPADLGAIGLHVLGARPTNATQSARFDAQRHGAAVVLSSNNAQAVWSAAGSCNQVALLGKNTTSYWVQIQDMHTFLDLGWCAADLDYTGQTWVGPEPKWLGYQGPGRAYLYRAGGRFKASTWPANTSQGVPYGRAFGTGDNVTALLHDGHTAEFLVNGVSMGNVSLPEAPPTALLGCVATCNGAQAALTGASSPGGLDVLVASGAQGAFAMNGVPLAPAGSARPRPAQLHLRVLVDRSLVEAFAQGGRATLAQAVYSPFNQTALVYVPATPAAPTPTVAVRVWPMRTAFLPSD